MTLAAVRRVVAGPGGDGRSRVLSDAAAQSTMENPDWPGAGVTRLWVDGRHETRAGLAHDPVAGPFTLSPPGGGATFMIVEMPPDAEVDGMDAARRARAKGPAGMVESTPSPGPEGMHETQTVEYAIMLAGELTLLLEDGETTLRAGDVLINRGGAHAWVNRGDVTAVKAVVSLDAPRRG